MSRIEAHRKKNFYKYSQALLVYGKRVYVNLLDWFYLGGDTNHLDYMLKEYNFYCIDDYLDCSRRYDLKYKNPEEYDMKLLFFLLNLTCRLYNGRPKGKNEEIYWEIEFLIEALMLQIASLTKMKPSLTNAELQDYLNLVTNQCEKLINEAGKVGGKSLNEIKRVHSSIAIGLRSLDSFVEIYNPGLDLNDLEPYSEKALTDLQKAADRVVSWKKESPTDNDYIAFYQDIADKKMFCRLSRRREPKTQNDEEKIKKFLEELEDYKRKLEGNKKVSRAEMEKIVSGKQTSVKKSGKKSKGKNVPPVKSGGENTLLCDSANQQESENQKGERDSKLSVTGEHLVGPQFEELSRDKIRLIALKYRFEVLVNPLICSKFSTQAIKPLLLNENFEFILKEDIVVSRHPDNFVHWKDLFCVEGMNNDFANIIILSGVPGIGKTFFTKYLIDWWNNDHELVNFESCKLIFFIDLKGNNFTKFSEYLSHEIKSPTDREVINAELLYTEVMNMPILTILDGYDNPCEKSLQLVKELLHLDGRDRKVLISCRPQYVETIVEHIPDVDRKYVSHISMTSASIDWYIDEFLRLIHYCLPPEKKKNVARWKELEVDYISKLTLMHAVFGDDLCNIRMLTYLTEMYMEAFSI